VDIVVGPPGVTIHAESEFLVCGEDGAIDPSRKDGYFDADTRLASEYRMTLSRRPLQLLNGSRIEPFSARFEFQNTALEGATGPVETGAIHVRLDRTVGHGMHEDYEVVNYSGREVETDLELLIASDFADLFEARRDQPIRRGRSNTTWSESSGIMRTVYRNHDFVRGLHIQVEQADTLAEFVNGRLSFRLALEPKQRWHACVLWMPLIGDRPLRRPLHPCSDLVSRTGGKGSERWIGGRAEIESSNPSLQATLDEAFRDLAALRLPDVPSGEGDPDERLEGDRDDGQDSEGDGWIVAAGVPWYVALFGRDTLVTALQTLPVSPAIAVGTLRATARIQADAYDDAHDAQPGKIAHELRRGELAHLRLIPQTPYYGTHDATSLFVWTVGELWRWTGNLGHVERMRPHVERALAWIDTDGAVDGIQAYRTRAGAWGYRNQGWRDAEDGVVDERGEFPTLPVATCELQGYVVAAKRRWADVLEHAFGEREAAVRLRDEADRLQEVIEERFWWEAEGTYFLGLDGNMEPIRSVTSNPGHLLWSGSILPERAVSVAARMLRSDLWSGWGVRTLSTDHPAYDPLSYQRGSIWPHDNAILCAGLFAYGLDEAAHTVMSGMIDAADRFHQKRVPEVFAGLNRDAASFPVQHIGANVPQAWASGAMLHLVVAALRMRPDAGEGTLEVDPSLPEILGAVRVRNVRVGDGSVELQACGREVTLTSADGVRVTRDGQALATAPARTGSESPEPPPASR
jgi:glycogen debranching enzyme